MYIFQLLLPEEEPLTEKQVEYWIEATARQDAKYLDGTLNNLILWAHLQQFRAPQYFYDNPDYKKRIKKRTDEIKKELSLKGV